jgi:hypothetical protein
MLFFAGLLVFGGFVMLHVARAAEQQHSLIPFKHGTISPLQGYAAGGLMLAFGIVVCAVWLTRWRRNNILTMRCSELRKLSRAGWLAASGPHFR